MEETVEMVKFQFTDVNIPPIYVIFEMKADCSDFISKIS